MRTEYLQYLDALAKYKSINKASLQLHLTPQALSAALKQLEQEVNAQLMIRSRQGVELTNAGKQVLKSSKVILTELDGMNQAIASILEDQSLRKKEFIGKLNIWVTPGLYTIGDMLSIILSFYKKHPHITTALFEKELMGVYQGMLEADDDSDVIGIVNIPRKSYCQALILPENLEFLPLCQDCFMIYVSKSSPLAKMEEISLAEVVKHPLVLYQHEGNENSTTYQILKNFGDPKIGFFSSNREILAEALMQNMGVGVSTKIASRNIYNEHHYDLVAIPITEKVTTDIGYLFKKPRKNSDIIDCFIAFFNQYFHI